MNLRQLLMVTFTTMILAAIMVPFIKTGQTVVAAVIGGCAVLGVIIGLGASRYLDKRDAGSR